MPISDNELEDLEDANENFQESGVVKFLRQNKDNGWYYVNEISDETDLARSSVIDAIENNQDVLKDVPKKKDGRRHRFVKYIGDK